MPKSRDLISLFRQLDNDYAAILHKKLNQYAKQEGHPGIHAQSEREYDVVTTTVTFGEDPELPKLQIQFYDWGFSDVIVSKVTQHQQPDGTMEKSYELLDRFSHRNNTFEAGREMAEFVYDNTTKYVQSFMQLLDPEQMTPLELPKRPSVPEDQDYQTVCAVRTLAGIARLAAKNGLQIGDDIRVTSTIDDKPFDIGLTTKTTIELGKEPNDCIKFMNSCEIIKMTPTVHGWTYVDSDIHWTADDKTIHRETTTRSKDGKGLRMDAETVGWLIHEGIRKPLREAVASRAIADAIELPDEQQL